MSSTPSVMIITPNAGQSYPATNSNCSSQSHGSVKNHADGFDGPKHSHKKEKKHPVRNFLLTVGAVTTAATLAIGALVAWRSPKIAADMLRQGHWNEITHHNVDAKCAEFTKSNEKFEAQVSKWSLPKSVKSALFSWRGKFYAAMEKEFPESSSALKERAKHDNSVDEEIKHNDALWKYVNHKRIAYNGSAERLQTKTRQTRGSRHQDETTQTSSPQQGSRNQNLTVGNQEARLSEHSKSGTSSNVISHNVGDNRNAPPLTTFMGRTDFWAEGHNARTHNTNESPLRSTVSNNQEPLHGMDGHRSNALREEGLGESYIIPKSPSRSSQSGETDIDFLSDSDDLPGRTRK